MTKFKKSQILVLSFLAVLLIITPLLPSSLRPTYIYFVINILIIALGAEAGLLSSFSKPSDDNKLAICTSQKPAVPSSQASPDKGVLRNTNGGSVAPDPEATEKKPKVVQKSASERLAGHGRFQMDKVKKCPSTPSLFFIGGGESEAAVDVAKENQADQEDEDVSGQELFTKAETFIGNFYKQLKMQREESWKRIHGFYQKAFWVFLGGAINALTFAPSY